MTAWDLLVEKSDLGRVQVVDVPAPEPRDGEVLLRVSRVGLTANNVTYAVFGESMSYWQFFPAETGWGRVPVWGFADVEASEVDGLDVGARVYGYLPTSSHLVVRPEGQASGRFRDTTEHRAALPAVYNAYNVTAADPSYGSASEDLQVLFRPLFGTAFFLADYLAGEFAGAETLVFGSASSKTAYCTAHLARQQGGPRVVGLTSRGNVVYTESLGCYDEVLAYDDVASLPAQPTVYVDMSGSADVRSRLHHHLPDDLLGDVAVGFTHHDEGPGAGGDLPGVRPTFFFAPDQIRRRTEEWGPAVLQERYGAAWSGFVPVAEGWVDVVEHEGPDGLTAVWRQLVAGAVDPRSGHVVRL